MKQIAFFIKLKTSIFDFVFINQPHPGVLY